MRRTLASFTLALLASCVLPACGPGDDTESSGTTTTGTTTTTEAPYDPPPVEAGFLQVPAQPAAAAFEARLFYSFHPAEEAPAKAPLLVFFNGGPGSATSAGLLPFGTGPFTMSTSMERGDMPVPNPDSMSRFAHLLHVDARQTGFSYGLSEGAAGCQSDSNALFDAGDFLFGLLDFLDARPALVDAPVVLVGESYGGTRAPTMIHLLQHYGDAEPLPARPDPRGVPGLVERIQAHFDRVHPERAGEVLTPEEVAEQFGFQILIQPNIAGELQFNFEKPLIAQDPVLMGYVNSVPAKSSYDVRMTLEEEARQVELATYAVVTPASFEALVGVAPEDVDLFGAADRTGAFRPEAPVPLPAEAFAEMEARTGKLGPSDYYWTGFANSCGYWLGDVTTASAFLGELPLTATFVTRARYDTVVYSPALPALLATAQLQVTQDDAPRAGVERPGWIQIAFETGEKAEIRFPPYEAGHAVAMTQAHALSQDVEAWLHEVGAFRE